MTKTLAIFLVAGLALAIFALTPQAASQMSLGTVTSILPLQSCPTSVNPPDRGFDPNVNMICSAATLSACPNNDDLRFVYGVAAPTGSLTRGTIVFFAGDGGHEASDGPDQLSLIEQYVANGFQVVQIAWGWALPVDWEYTNASVGNYPTSILNAACRPASFLNWVRNGSSPNVGKGIWATYGKGMCAHGHSAGSAALAYALAWYNAGASATAWGSGYLDTGIFTSGPVFSDIRQGCQVPNSNTTFICQNSPEQAFCKGSVKPGVQVNNAASQGQLYWGQFTNTSQFISLTVNAITGCPSTENVLGGDVPNANPPEKGIDAILQDMKASCAQRH